MMLYAIDVGVAAVLATQLMLCARHRALNFDFLLSRSSGARSNGEIASHHTVGAIVDAFGRHLEFWKE
jgi:hypothetical protein